MAYQEISKNRTGARNFSREAGHLEFDMGTKQPLIGGKRTIGGANVDQLNMGVTYGNVQSAIDDLYTLSEQIPINGVLTLTVDSPPIAVQQVETITFNGAVLNPAEDETKGMVHVYGFPFLFDNGATASNVCEAVEAKFQDFVAQDLYFDQVTRKGVNGEMLEVRFIDSIPHPATLTSESGITQTGVIDVVGANGYGSWVKLGSGNLPNVTPEVPVFYFKRIA